MAPNDYVIAYFGLRFTHICQILRGLRLSGPTSVFVLKLKRTESEDRCETWRRGRVFSMFCSVSAV